MEEQPLLDQDELSFRFGEEEDGEEGALGVRGLWVNNSRKSNNHNSHNHKDRFSNA